MPSRTGKVVPAVAVAAASVTSVASERGLGIRLGSGHGGGDRLRLVLGLGRELGGQVDLLDDAFRGETMPLTQVVDGAGVFDEGIGPADADHRGGDTPVGERLQDDAAVAAHERVVFEGHDDVGGAAEELVCGDVEGFAESRIDEGAVPAFVFEAFDGLAGDGLHVAEGEEGGFALAVAGEVSEELFSCWRFSATFSSS